MESRKPRRAVTAALVVVAALLAATGCGDSDDEGSTTTKPAPTAATVDSSTVESQIKKQLSSSTAEVTKVKCPTDVKSSAGATFKCDVTWSNGATGQVKVTAKGANQFTYDVVAGSVQIPGESVAKTLEKDLAQQGAPNATVSCPQNIIVKVGTTVTCNVTGAGGTATGDVTFTFSSETGDVESSSVQTE
jgi:Domain of unknown function (DUF4333)